MWPFTPSQVVKDLHNPFYRGCWHEFSLCLLIITFIIFIICQIYNKNNTFFLLQKLTESYLYTLFKIPYCSQLCSGTFSSPLWQYVRQNLLGILGLIIFLYFINYHNTIKTFILTLLALFFY